MREFPDLVLMYTADQRNRQVLTLQYHEICCQAFWKSESLSPTESTPKNHASRDRLVFTGKIQIIFGSVQCARPSNVDCDGLTLINTAHCGPSNFTLKDII